MSAPRPGELKPEEYGERRAVLEGFPVRIISYRLGPLWHFTVDNVEPGARIARAEGADRAQAERSALEDASRRLARTVLARKGRGQV